MPDTKLWIDVLGKSKDSQSKKFCDIGGKAYCNIPQQIHTHTLQLPGYGLCMQRFPNLLDQVLLCLCGWLVGWLFGWLEVGWLVGFSLQREREDKQKATETTTQTPCKEALVLEVRTLWR